jgi:hypothetical protein
MLVAEAYLGRMRRPADGMRALRAVLDEPRCDPLTRKQAARQLVEAMVARGDIDGARTEAHARADLLDARFVATTDRLVRRRTLRHLALLAAAALVAFSVGSATRAVRKGRGAVVGRAVRKLTPLVVVFAAYIGVVGGLLASSYESGNAKPFLVLGVAVVPVFLLARVWSAAGSATVRARAARAAAAATGAMAMAFLVLDALDPAYLEGFGL